MLQSSGFLVVTTIIATVVLPLGEFRAIAQTTDSTDSICYLQIEGRSSQDLTHLCGKKPGGSRAISTVNNPTLREELPNNLDEEEDADQVDEADAPTPIPPRPIPAPPTASPRPTSVTPLQPLAVPAPPSAGQPQRNVPALPNPAPNASDESLEGDAPEEVSEDTVSQRQQPTQSSLDRSPARNLAAPTSKPQAKPANPQTSNLTSAQKLPPPPSALPLSPVPPTPSPSSLAAFFQTRYLLLFWLLCLPIPLVKVAIDQRSRPQLRQKTIQVPQITKLQSVWQHLNPWRMTLKPVPIRIPQRSESSQPVIHPLVEEQNRLWNSPQSPVEHQPFAPPSPAPTALKQPEPENIAAVAEYQLSQTNSQIEKIKTIIASALRNRVSDIHLEPTTEGLRIRYRIDGILRNVTLLPPEISRRAIVALKVMADMDISDSRRPQDARISEHVALGKGANLDLDLRVSTLPCIGGEKAVIRLLPRQNPFSSIDQLGFTKHALAIYQSWLKQPQGMIIFTGPTGSGKTSTLYTTLQAIATEYVNVVTVEDPVEYVLPCITQTQVNEVAGMTFAAGLRAILRQDPDIIMVGEIRDSETAETAVRSALTGHLVLTTLHTNDAVGAIPRLKDIGPDPGLISDALLGVVAQRLVRRVCPHCAEPYSPTAADLTILGLRLEDANPHSWRRGRGCTQCFDSGYLGREAIVELLHVDNAMRRIIYEGSLTELTDYLHTSDFDSFRKAAIAKVITGITTVEEIERVLPHSKLTE